MKVLLADDTEIIQRMYGRALSEAGYEVVLANDGQIAYDKAQQISPDLILLDVMTPNVNGMEALEMLKADHMTNPIPVIMLSADDDGTRMMKAMKNGAKRYLVKSMLEPSQVVEIIGTVIAESTAKWSLRSLFWFGSCQEAK